MVFHPSKETHFGLFYNAFPSFVCVSSLTACSLSSRCASRGICLITWGKALLVRIGFSFLSPPVLVLFLHSITYVSFASTVALVHPNQPFHLPHHHKRTMYQPNRFPLLKGVHQLLIQMGAVLLPQSLI